MSDEALLQSKLKVGDYIWFVRAGHSVSYPCEISIYRRKIISVYQDDDPLFPNRASYLAADYYLNEDEIYPSKEELINAMTHRIAEPEDYPARFPGDFTDRFE